MPAQALTDDDDFYAPAAIRYADWLSELFTSPRTALSVTGIDAGFGLNHEHPPFAKLVVGVVERMARVFDGLPLLDGTIERVRLGTVCFVVVLAFVLVRWLYRPLGGVVAVGSVLVLLSLPRFFLHSEVPTLDVPVAVMILLVTAAFERARGDTRAGFVVGVLFGLAAATKLNAPFAVVPLIVLTVLERWRGFGLVDVDGVRDLASLRLPPIPASLWWMAVVGPVVFVAVWPWLWPDVLPRIGAYVAFHLRHYPIYLFFDGEIFDKPFAPGIASVVLGFGSVPVVVVVAAAIGAVQALRSLARITVGATADGRTSSSRDRILALCLMQGALSLGVVAVSDVPRYGGEKLFMPLFPFLAVLAAVGAKQVVDIVVGWLPSRRPLAGPDLVAGRDAPPLSDGPDVLAGRDAQPSPPPPPSPVPGEGGAYGSAALWRRVIVGIVFAALLAPGVVGIAKTWGGYGLSYYGELVGGLRGAVARGYERTYYDLADLALAQTLDVVAAGKRVHAEPNHKEYVRTWRWLRKDGVIRRDGFVIESRFEAADIVVLMHERRWKTYPALRTRLRGSKVLAEKRVDGVPLWTVYER